MNLKLTTLFIFLLTLTAKAQTDGILWLGIDNPVTVKSTTTSLKHPFFKSADATASLQANGTFIVAVTNYKSVGQIIQLDLYDSVSTGSKKISSYHYLVKRTPDPVFSIAGKLIHDTISRSDLLKTKTINVALDDVDFNLDLRFQLQSFDLEIDGKEFHSNSNQLTNSMIYFITNTTGAKIRILNDKTIMANSTDKTARCVLNGCDKTFILAK